jgi:uncharacterized protein DUF2752
MKIALVVFIPGGLLFLYFLFNPTDHSFFLTCPLLAATGYYCPGCGSQRAIHQLLHGNIETAFWLNPLLMITLPILIYALGQKAYNFIFDTQYRVGIFYNKGFIYGYFGLAILYWILRNLTYYPFTLLSPSNGS